MAEGSPAGRDEFAGPEEFVALLRPRGIAVVGASAEAGRFSTRLIPSLLACGYAGGIYPVNPRYTEVAGLPCYPSIAEVPAPCDLAIVAVPSRHVPGVVAAAAARGVRAAIVLSAGFAEIGPAGAGRAEELRQAAAGLRLYGPNSPGLWQIRDGLVYTFSSRFEPEDLSAGRLGLVTQGGALGRAVLDAMAGGLGFSYWFSTGNEADLDAADFLAFLARDAGTAAVAMIVEGWRDGRRFLRALARCRGAEKPVVLLKIGRTLPGARAARSHTAAVNGSPLVARTALRQAGCLLVEDVDELVGVAGLLAAHPHPGPGGLGICSFSGGAGGLLADLAQEHGLQLPQLRPETAADLRALLPEIAAVGNPTDLTTAVLEDPTLARRALEIMLGDPGLAAVAFPLPHRLDTFDDRMAPLLVEVAAAARKPVVVVALSPFYHQEAAAAVLAQGRVPVFRSARQAVRALAGWLGARDAEALPAWQPPAAAPAAGTEGPDVLAACGIAPLDGRAGWDLCCRLEWDAAFGPAVTCGPGGPAGRAFPEDRAARLAPFPPAEARALLAALRLPAAEGRSAAEMAAAAATLSRLADWAAAVREPFPPVVVDPLRILPGGLGVTGALRPKD